MKRWVYWCVTSASHAFAVTIADLGYAGLASVYLIDFAAQTMRDVSLVRSRKHAVVAETTTGLSTWRSRGLSIDVGDDPAVGALGATRIRVRADRLGGAPLAADLVIDRLPPEAALRVRVPMSRTCWAETVKAPCRTARGVVTIGGPGAASETIAFDGQEAFAVLDWGQGEWPRSVTWNWASMAARVDGVVVGLNLGAGWTHGSGVSENAVFIDGRVYPIGSDATFEHGPGRDGQRGPWRLRADGVDLTLEPRFLRAVGGGGTSSQQAFGTFRGRLQGAFGTIELMPELGARGFAERFTTALW